MKVIWSFVAAGNIVEQNQYIAKDDPEAARAVIKDIFNAGDCLKEFPEKGRVVPEFGNKNIKEIICRSYRIIYKIEPKRITILTVRHMREQLKQEDVK
ncbi:MAG: type II toxin-antitoxin system RelE/ParE family toxin [Chloroflexota bacterium]